MTNSSTYAPTAFKHFGLLEKQKMGVGPRIASLCVMGTVLGLLVLLSITQAKVIQQKVQQAELHFIAPDITPPPPPPIHLTPPPPTLEVHTPPRIEMPRDIPEPVKVPEIKMNIPAPVIASAPRLVKAAAAPKMVALNVAPASVPNHNNAPSAVALGDPNALKASANPKASAVTLGLAGMPARNNGAGAAGARSISLGSGSPNGSAGGTDRGRSLAGIRLGVPNGQGTGNARSNSPVSIGTLAAVAPPAQLRTVAAATSPVNITYTPHPAYTNEAAARKISGIVDVEVVFKANGSVQVIRVVRGLGFGLDQNALSAAQQIRFRPAMQNGQPIDQHTVVHIQFQTIS